MKYKIIKPYRELEPFIHFYWELKGNELESQRERVFPDGCSGILMNLGDNCLTDNGSVLMEFGKTYVVGAMSSFKDSVIDTDTHLIGACLKPGTFRNFYASRNELINDTVEFEKSQSFNLDKAFENPFNYFDHFFSSKLKSKNYHLQSIINDIHSTKGQLGIYELSKRNCTTVRQLERNFKKLIGLSPKKYSNIIRFRNAMSLIKYSKQNRSLLDIAFECGYYDHSHLTNVIKQYTGLLPSDL
ncbi:MULTISPECIES: helix-turn-helix domain-containing protein [unclassified Arenibacter]|jgi:AraC-like DNA-binding protein|uniref:helix-turn-helix domain-containing protein n=1 Tax=unclassified Arenibacter TaxID=2615047 RepID=UPI000E346802|nr:MULTISPECIES: helix-turn-helix domain-containing protein [unclassified Arenibacter]MCM4165341.1 AraC family transcriptional regulator [Arenibacter sp. A80]RFT55189.1 AraC family transcriptional regulator [Arenibacter sp. P308M17]